MAELAALVFDVDGTLAETEEGHRHAFNAAFEAWGLDWHWDQALYRELLVTTGGKERIAAFIRDYAPESAPTPGEIAALHADKTRYYGALLAGGEIGLRPGIAALINDARTARMRLAIATTTSRANVDALIRVAFGREAEQVFDVIAAGDEVARKKPAPDVYELALSRLGVPPTQALALEDSRNGLLSARTAAIACVVCPGIYTQGQQFTEATGVIDSFRDLRLPAWQAVFEHPERRKEWP